MAIAAGVQIQIFATWIFSAVLNQLCIDVAIALNQPLDLISTEMVFRSLYHFSQALHRGDASDAVPYLVERQKLFGLVKTWRNSKLSLGDLFNQDYPAELIVLSACETGLGKDINGEGLVGLTRGLMYAGAARVAVSLWQVSDEGTSVLMQEF